MFKVNEYVQVIEYPAAKEVIGLQGRVIRVTPQFVEVEFPNRSALLFRERELDKIEN